MAALGAGLWAAARNARLLGWLLLGNLLLAVAGVWPLLEPMEESLAWHPAAEEMTRRFDMAWWVDLTTSRAEAFARTHEMVGVVAFLAAMMGCFFAGGLLQAYQDTFEGRAMDRFLLGCRRWFWRYVRLFVLALPIYWLVHRVMNTHLELALRDLLERVADERAGLALTLAKSAVFLCLFDLVTLCVAYARAHALITSERSMIVALRAGILFVLRHPVRVAGLEALVLILQGAALFIYLPFDALLGRNSAAGLITGFLAGQGFLIVRLFLREAARAGHLAILRSGGGHPDAAGASAPVARPDQAAA